MIWKAVYGCNVGKEHPPNCAVKVCEKLRVLYKWCGRGTADVQRLKHCGPKALSRHAFLVGEGQG